MIWLHRQIFHLFKDSNDGQELLHRCTEESPSLSLFSCLNFTSRERELLQINSSERDLFPRRQIHCQMIIRDLSSSSFIFEIQMYSKGVQKMLSGSLWTHQRALGEDVSYDNFTNLDEFLRLKRFDERSAFKNTEVALKKKKILGDLNLSLEVALYDSFS